MRAWTWYRARSRRKQVVLGVVAVLLVSWIGSAWIGGGDGGTKAQARPAAVVHATPDEAAPKPEPKVWAGITQAQAVRLAQLDNNCAMAFVLSDRKTQAPCTGHEREDIVLVTMAAEQVRCFDGRAYWKLSYGDMPAPWYERRMIGRSECEAPIPCDANCSQLERLIHRRWFTDYRRGRDIQRHPR